MQILLLLVRKHLLSNIHKAAYLAALMFIVISFIFLPHTIEHTGVLETWFPYKGLIYYKDFGAYHFPLGRLILLPIHILTNWDLRVDPFLALATALLTLHLVYIYAKKFNSKLPIVAGTLFFSVFFWYGATAILFFHEMLIGLLLALATLLIFQTQTTKEVNIKTAFISGLVLSLTGLSGQIAIPTIVVISCLTLLLWKRKPNFAQAIKYFILGLVIPLSGLVYYFYKTNALYEFYFWNIPYYFIYNSNPKSPFFTLPLAELFAFYIPVGLISIPLLLNLKKIDFEVKFLLLASLSSIPFIFFSIFHPHHLNYILPILALTFSKGISLLINKFRIILLSGLVIFITVSIFYLLPWHYQRFKPPSLAITNDIIPGDHMYETVQWVRNNTPGDARILVIGDSMFYMRSDRLPAVRPGKGLPYSWEPFPIIRNELLANPGKYWVVDQRFVDRLGDAHNRPYMVEFIRTQLQQCYKKVFTEENWEVHKRFCN